MVDEAKTQNDAEKDGDSLPDVIPAQTMFIRANEPRGLMH